MRKCVLVSANTECLRTSRKQFGVRRLVAAFEQIPWCSKEKAAFVLRFCRILLKSGDKSPHSKLLQEGRLVPSPSNKHSAVSSRKFQHLKALLCLPLACQHFLNVDLLFLNEMSVA